MELAFLMLELKFKIIPRIFFISLLILFTVNGQQVDLEEKKMQ